MQASYTKLRSGEWGARVLGDPPQAGDEITVTTKKGDKKQERVKIVIWTGQDRDTDQPVALCALESESDRREDKRDEPKDGGRRDDW